MITVNNILLNIDLKTVRIHLNNDDLRDDWRKTATKYNCVLEFKDKKIILDYYMGAAHTSAPTKHDILYSLIMDDVSDMNFDDFCANFGYDEDSIKALRTYEACQKQTKEFYNVFNAEEREMLRELLEDY